LPLLQGQLPASAGSLAWFDIQRCSAADQTPTVLSVLLSEPPDELSQMAERIDLVRWGPVERVFRIEIALIHRPAIHRPYSAPGLRLRRL
jgi:hypothetical protein